MKNNMPAKAVPIYEEILKKYPKTRRTEEVTKLLDEAKKKLGGK
jgi:outer membrane protein assembly factor BamD (BamD/ComL family)